jgi:hypothetical protein
VSRAVVLTARAQRDLMRLDQAIAVRLFFGRYGQVILKAVGSVKEEEEVQKELKEKS